MVNIMILPTGLLGKRIISTLFSSFSARSNMYPSINDPVLQHACIWWKKNDLITVLLPVSDKESKKYFFCKSYVHPTLNHERHTCTVMTIYKEWKGDWMNNLSLPAVDQKPNLQNKAVYTCISFIKVRKNWNIDCGRHMYSHVFSKISFITFFPS